MARSRAPGRAFALGLCLALGLTATACDREYFARTDFGTAPREGLRLVASDVADGVHAGRDAVRVRFDRPVDPASVGARSVRVVRPGGRRVRRLRTWVSGAELFVAAAPGRSLPANVELTLRIEGGGSPRSLRAGDGTVLSAPIVQHFRSLERRRIDLEGPRLLASYPPDGSSDVAPGGHVQLTFDEPLARAAVRGGRAVAMRIDNRPTPARLRLSPDLTRLVVRPKRRIPPGALVSIEVLPALLDLSGNPAAQARLRFWTKATRLRELSEDFVTTEMVDPHGTTGGWATPETPGFLVARAGRLRWSPVDGEHWSRALPAVARVRIQTLFPADSAPGGVVSAVRVFLEGAREGDVIPAADVDLGPTALFRVDPTFEANRGASDLAAVARVEAPLPVETDEFGQEYVDVPFDVPLALRAGTAALLDIDLTLPVGVSIAATPDPGALALVENLGIGDLLPATELLVSGGAPQARSSWRDSGIARPGWQTAVVSGSGAPGADAAVEFQTAAATVDGLPDLDRASEWASDLAQLPALRFVRFRVTFTRLGALGQAPHIDRIVLPFQE